MTLSEELAWRGFANQSTYKDITVLDGDPITFYLGVDPSANSMTIGNLATAMMARCFIKHGHKAVLLVGGATGLIGDPDGKSEERDPKSLEEIARNKAAITTQYKQVFNGQKFTLVDNYDWFHGIKYLDFLREVGKHVPLRQMLARDFVQSRLGEQGAGISYAEFSYVLIQAYDFLHLYQHNGVTLQVCGSDQWGNSIAGVDLIRRQTGGQAHVYSSPLITDKISGKKFGKTEKGAIWLDAAKTSAYQFYQFWLNTDDQSVEAYIKVFTELEPETTKRVMAEFNQDKAGRKAQKTLAYEVTTLIHGKDQANKQVRIAEAVASQDLARLSDAELATVREEIPAVRIKSTEKDLVGILVSTGLAASNSEARQLIVHKSIYVNGVATTSSELHSDQFHDGRLLLRRGKAFRDSALVELG